MCRSYGSHPGARAKPYRSCLKYLDHQVGIDDLSVICPTYDKRLRVTHLRPQREKVTTKIQLQLRPLLVGDVKIGVRTTTLQRPVRERHSTIVLLLVRVQTVGRRLEISRSSFFSLLYAGRKKDNGWGHRARTHHSAACKQGSRHKSTSCQ